VFISPFLVYREHAETSRRTLDQKEVAIDGQLERIRALDARIADLTTSKLSFLYMEGADPYLQVVVHPRKEPVRQNTDEYSYWEYVFRVGVRNKCKETINGVSMKFVCLLSDSDQHQTAFAGMAELEPTHHKGEKEIRIDPSSANATAQSSPDGLFDVAVHEVGAQGLGQNDLRLRYAFGSRGTSLSDWHPMSYEFELELKGQNTVAERAWFRLSTPSLEGAPKAIGAYAAKLTRINRDGSPYLESDGLIERQRA